MQADKLSPHGSQYLLGLLGAGNGTAQRQEIGHFRKT
jgi:hypothetical protein